MRMGPGDFNAALHDRARPGNVSCVPLIAGMRCRAVGVLTDGIERDPVCQRPTPRGLHVFSIRSAAFGR